MTERDELIWRALLALDEVYESVGRTTRPSGWGLRFVLAFLFAQGSKKERAPYDAFWRATKGGVAKGDAARVRRRQAEFALIAILYDVGIEPLPSTLEKLRRREPLTEGLHVRLRAVAIIAENERQRDLDKEYARGLHG